MIGYEALCRRVSDSPKDSRVAGRMLFSLFVHRLPIWAGCEKEERIIAVAFIIFLLEVNKLRRTEMQKEDILGYLAEIKSDLKQKGIERIALFGSFAKNKADSFSDIDIAIQLQEGYLKKHDVWEYFDLIDAIRKMLVLKFSRKVDVFDLDAASEIKNRITGDIIYV